MERWRPASRIPASWEEARRSTPDAAILKAAGFQIVGHYEFPTAHVWTPDSVVGFLYSTSVLSRQALGDLAPDFEQDVRRILTGELRQLIDFGYDLARNVS